MLEIANQLILDEFDLLIPNLLVGKFYFEVLALRMRFHGNHP